MENELNEIPVKISNNEYDLYGVLRVPEQCDRLAIFVPWVLGDRTGMGRVYVEVARVLYNVNVATFCVDLPPNNYSDDYISVSLDDKLRKQAFFIEIYTEYVRKHYPSLEIIIVGYCSSCIAALYAARKLNLPKIIMINPWDYMSTFIVQPPHDIFYDYFKYTSNHIKIHHIIAEHEGAIQRKMNYLKKYFEDDNCSTTMEIVPKADHLFCNWEVKKKFTEILKEEIVS